MRGELGRMNPPYTISNIQSITSYRKKLVIGVENGGA